MRAQRTPGKYRYDMGYERDYLEGDDPGATLHGRRLVSTSKIQRQVDATMAKLRSQRAEDRRERLREDRVRGRRAWDRPDDATS